MRRCHPSPRNLPHALVGPCQPTLLTPLGLHSQCGDKPLRVRLRFRVNRLVLIVSSKTGVDVFDRCHPLPSTPLPQAWNKWFTKGPGRSRRGAIRPRHPHAPPGLPPAGLRAPASFVPPPPPPPVFSLANLRRQKEQAKWRVRRTSDACKWRVGEHST